MLNVDSLQRGLVIDHIKAGKSMDIYKYLNLDKLDSCVAIIKNVKSNKSGKKDIIKIEDEIDTDITMLGFVDENITVNIIDNGKIIKKTKVMLPKEVKNIVKCKNPRCITSIEQELPHIFKLTNEKNGVYRCIYCEQEADRTKLNF